MSTGGNDSQVTKCGQTVERTRYPPRQILAREVARKHDCYASVEEMKQAVKDGTYKAGRDIVMIGGRMYFLCKK